MSFTQDLMNGLKKGVLVIGSYSLLGGSVMYITNSQEWLEENLPRIIQEQEKDTGLQYEDIPPVHWMVYKETDSLVTKVYLSALAGGNYEPTTKQIFINPFATSPYPLVRFLTLSYDSNGTIRHELGHYYTHKLSERIGYGDWMNLDQKCSDRISDCIGTKLVIEGIGRWFEKKGKDETDSFTDNQWPEYTARIQRTLFIGNF